MQEYAPREEMGRVLGQHLAISVATAIPLERHFTNAEFKADTDALWLNVATLWRNFKGSYATEQVWTRTLETFIEEVENILGLLAGEVACHLYYCHPDALYSAFPNADVKAPSTPKQIEEEQAESVALARLFQEDSITIHRCKVLLPEHNHRAMIITHRAVDLLSRYRFRDLLLVESHTGRILPARQWGGKLTGKREFNEKHLPFNALTLAIVGDKSTNFKSNVAYSRKLKSVAEQKHWHGLTTMDKIKKDLHSLYPSDAEAILAYAKHSLT